MPIKKKLVVVGGGALGREVALYAQDMIDAEAAGLEFDGIAGFLDDSATAADQLSALGVQFDFVEPAQGHVARNDCVYIIAVGNAKVRRVLRDGLAGKPHYANVIHPTAYVASSAVLGQGVIVAPFGFVGANATLQDHVVLNTYASAGHDSLVGRYCVFSPYAVINGNVELGEEVFMGTHATVIPGLTVGKSSSLAAGAVVVRDVQPEFFMMGNPSKGWRMYEDNS
ncbi:acetyltransferase [Adhaeretor mobilis]|uniref:Acetyltransferase EpsM n=1 Tax=Adhaeretor mobilis TaxID=1930276 RepID=A0A517MQA1_9BACT|nr:acetyltransferase [Adhaeretor mobilis]QDS96967.1 Putative acetyltransferase EpsM [Adhaeretor mobilis]